MEHLDERATTLIREVKSALALAAPELEENKLRVDSVKLDLEATIELDAGGKVSLLKILTLEAKHTHTETQTIAVTLKPPSAGEASRQNLLPTIGDELEQAIVVIAAAAKEAATEPPALALQDAEVALEVAVTNEGNVEVFAEGSGKEGNTHTLTIGLKAA
jgi:NTP-dependent ternary system trypsin peptidase co-occuring protein